MALKTACALVQHDFEAIDQFILNQLESNILIINQMVDYVLKCGGKRIRPLILLLSAKALHHTSENSVPLAAVIELIHTATLLHDDVVDNSTLRRGHKTANTLWGNEASVLIGDFLYSRAFQIVVNLHHQPVLDIFAHATHYIAEGEILQLVQAHRPDTTEAAYFDIIHRKTAKLFEMAAELGVIMGNQEERKTKAMREYGLNLGLAYQLIDDALDYSRTSEQTGKSVGNDIMEGKVTLPMIYALHKGSQVETALLRKVIETGEVTQVESIVDIVESTGAIEYTAQVAKQYVSKACSALIPIPSSPYRQSLQDLAEFVVERSY